MRKILIIIIILISLLLNIYGFDFSEVERELIDKKTFDYELNLELALGNVYYLSDGSTYASENQFILYSIKNNIWCGITDFLNLGLTIPIMINFGKNDFENNSPGLGDIYLTMRGGKKNLLLDIALVFPTGTSELEKDNKNINPTGGRIVTPYGGTFNIELNFYYLYKPRKTNGSIIFTGGYIYTQKRKYRDTRIEIDPGDALKYSICYKNYFSKNLIFGISYLGFNTFPEKWAGIEIEKTDISRSEFVPFIQYINKSKNIYSFGFNYILNGKNVQRFHEIYFKINF